MLTHSWLCLFMFSHSRQQQERPVYIFVFYRRLSWISFLLLSPRTRPQPGQPTKHTPTVSRCLSLSLQGTQGQRQILSNWGNQQNIKYSALVADNLYKISDGSLLCGKRSDLCEPDLLSSS